ncbi:60S acidic ribosomal protein P2 [Lamellibrachia satsuma]|nr:60S acidic ribosomal protein P2 [Lamellibrachia satsuma]
MRYVAAYLLAVLGGTANPTDKDIKKILSSVGIDADDACLMKVISELKGKDINEVMAAGREKLTSVPSGGGVAASSGGAGADDKKEEAKKEEPESEDEDDADMGFGLFD